MMDDSTDSRTAASLQRWVVAHSRAVGVDVIGLILVCGGAMGLYLYRLGAASLWLDEGISFWSAQVDWSNPVHALESGNVRYQPLYFLLLRGAMTFGTSEFMLRALSVLGAVLALGLAYGFLRQHYGLGTATVACLLLATNPLFLSYAQEARGYSLLVAASVLATWLFVRTTESGRWSLRLAYGATAGLGAYLHLFIAWTVAAHLVALVGRPWPRRWLPVAAAVALATLIGAPLLVVMLAQGSEGLSWIPDPSFDQFSSVVKDLGGGGWGALALLVAALVAVIPAGRRGSKEGRWPTTVLLSTLVVPLVGAALASLAMPMLVSRYLIAVVFPLTALAAIGLLRLPVRRLSLLFVLAAVGLMVQPNVAHYEHPTKEDWRSAAASILDRSKSGDVILIYAAGVRQPYEYYARQDGSGPPPRVLYPAGEWEPGHFIDSDSSSPVSAAVGEALKQRRVWVVLSHVSSAREEDRILDALDAKYRVSYQRIFAGGVTVLLYERHD
jgi:mannosyltransferase